jgi:hypothetical protein
MDGNSNSGWSQQAVIQDLAARERWRFLSRRLAGLESTGTLFTGASIT